jgi:5'-3' exonuclease
MQVKRINEYLEILPVKNINVPYVEADDIIAEICNTNEDQCIIYSTDADYKQLISDRVACYNPMAKQLTTRARFIEKYGFIPENFIFYKMITGDASDGLPGVKGIGPKTFLKLYPNASENIIESTNDLLNHSSLAINSPNTSVAMKNKHKVILENSELLQTNWTMMQLQDVEVSQQTKDVVQQIINRQPNEFNRMRLRVMFIEDKLQSQVKSFDDWSRTFSGVVLKGRTSSEK